jgi:hypothetical protein
MLPLSKTLAPAPPQRVQILAGLGAGLSGCWTAGNDGVEGAEGLGRERCDWVRKVRIKRNLLYDERSAC